MERIYGFIQSHPFPDRWLEEQERAYAADTPVAETIWGLAVRARILDTLRYAAALLDKAVELADGEEKMAAAYGPAASPGGHNPLMPGIASQNLGRNRRGSLRFFLLFFRAAVKV